MPDVVIYNEREFNIKIIFHPTTGITEEEQVLCTAAAIAFVNSFLLKKNFVIFCVKLSRKQL